jgi:hypothetical protein
VGTFSGQPGAPKAAMTSPIRANKSNRHESRNENAPVLIRGLLMAGQTNDGIFFNPDLELRGKLRRTF